MDCSRNLGNFPLGNHAGDGMQYSDILTTFCNACVKTSVGIMDSSLWEMCILPAAVKTSIQVSQGMLRELKYLYIIKLLHERRIRTSYPAPPLNKEKVLHFSLYFFSKFTVYTLEEAVLHVSTLRSSVRIQPHYLHQLEKWLGQEAACTRTRIHGWVVM